MRVLFDYQAFSIQRHGGVSRYFYEIANHLQTRAEFDVEILAPLYVCDYFSSRSLVMPRGFKVPLLSRTSIIRRFANAGISWVMSRHRQDIDVFHETYYSMADTKPASAKRVITVFDMIHEKFPDHFSNTASIAQVKLASILRADHVICISESTRQDLIAITNLDPKKTSVVHLGYGLDTRGASTPPPDLNGRNYLLYVGLRAGYKNFKVLLDAFAQSSALRTSFVLVCFGGPPFTSDERLYMGSLGLDPEVVIYRAGNDRDLAGYYSSAVAFVYPSLYEGFGIPPLEAMSLGCPVICSTAGSLPEVVGNAAELFDPTDAEDLRRALEEVLDRPAHAKALVALGLKRTQMFSWEKCARETADIYSRLS